jgi:hypothetical protein
MQAKVNKQTHIKARRYPKEEYRKFTPAKKREIMEILFYSTSTGPPRARHRLHYPAYNIDSNIIHREGSVMADLVMYDQE